MFKITPLNVIITHLILRNSILIDIILILLNKTTPFHQQHTFFKPRPQKESANRNM